MKHLGTGHRYTPRHKRFFKTRKRIIIMSAAFVVIAIGVTATFFLTQKSSETYKRDETITQIIRQHTVDWLIGEQSRIQDLQSSIGNQKTIGLKSCPSPNDTVTKTVKGQSFAYILIMDQVKGYQHCSITDTVKAYGRPNSSTKVAGNLADPKETMLFYDKGPGYSPPSTSNSPPKAPATILPTGLANIAKPTCTGKTILTVVAHQDDDLLFMNPDLLHALHSKDCLRTVYLTAGDAGIGSVYWLGREKGSEAAYDSMLGTSGNVWVERLVAINDHEYITLATPRDRPNVTLIFMRLPDGNVAGGGFPATHYESIEKLDAGSLATINSVDHQSKYTKAQLTDLLSQLIDFYQPASVNTQTIDNQSTVHPDHSDHMAAGRITQAAVRLHVTRHQTDLPLTFYTGYPIDQLPPNVGGVDLTQKSAAFYNYAAHDSHTCHNASQCAKSSYSQWLQRQYVHTP